MIPVLTLYYGKLFMFSFLSVPSGQIASWVCYSFSHSKEPGSSQSSPTKKSLRTGDEICFKDKSIFLRSFIVSAIDKILH